MQGYLPGQLYNLSSKYGTKEELQALLKAFKDSGIVTLADIVINHRCADAQDENGVWNTFRSVLALTACGLPIRNQVHEDCALCTPPALYRFLFQSQVHEGDAQEPYGTGSWQPLSVVRQQRRPATTQSSGCHRAESERLAATREQLHWVWLGTQPGTS